MFGKLTAWFSSASAPDEGASQPEVRVYAPVTGHVIPLEEVADPVFSQKMLGDGMAIEPASSQVLAPFDGSVAATFPTMHAIGLRSHTGLECLIHVGIDTVTLEGQGFHLLVEEGQKVKQGTPLIELNYQLLRASGKDLVTPVVITNSDCWQILQRSETAAITAGTDILFTARPVKA